MSVASTRPAGPTRRAAVSDWPPAPAATSRTALPVWIPAASSISVVASPSQPPGSGPRRATRRRPRPIAGGSCPCSGGVERGGHRVSFGFDGDLSPRGARVRGSTAGTRPAVALDRVCGSSPGTIPGRPLSAVIGRCPGFSLPSRRRHRAARLVLVSGEAGMGKTTLVGVAAARSGLAVGWGTGAEAERTPAFWPWTTALRALFPRWIRDVAELTGTDAPSWPGCFRSWPRRTGPARVEPDRRRRGAASPVRRRRPVPGAARSATRRPGRARRPAVGRRVDRCAAAIRRPALPAGAAGGRRRVPPRRARRRHRPRAGRARCSRRTAAAARAWRAEVFELVARPAAARPRGWRGAPA